MTIKKLRRKVKFLNGRNAAMTAATVFTAGAILIGTNTLTAKAESYTYSIPVAGASVMLDEYLEEQQSVASLSTVSLASIAAKEVDVTTLSETSASASFAANSQALAYITQNYTSLGIANVNTSLNVRETPVNGKIVGRIPANGACEVLEETDGWFKVKSGDVEGYVSGNYLLTGELATQRAINTMSSEITVNVSGLNMRKSASTSSKVLKVLRKGAEAKLLEDKGEWLKVLYNNTTGYVYAKYTSKEYDLPKARTMDEIKYGTEVSDIREQLVEYAKQFVGNPYVYGGNSLTKGTDCSGFVKLIMAHFGISTPRTASTQYNAGEKISRSELLPGDLVVYGGKRIEHIAIYIGDGQVVHASNVKTGIKYSKYNYRDIYGYVRFIND